VNADFDPSTAKSRAGFIITYGACPIIWASKLMQEVALSTTEAEYGAISLSLRDVIFLMQMVAETAAQLKWETSQRVPTVHCKLFEDNSGALEMARLPKMGPRTKHVCVKMHHFREHVRTGKVSINKVPTRYQLGDIATKAQPEALFESQRESLLQWKAEFQTREELTLPTEHLRACDISDSAESLCKDQHARSFRESASAQRAGRDPTQHSGGNGLLEAQIGRSHTTQSESNGIGTEQEALTGIMRADGNGQRLSPKIVEQKAIKKGIKGKELREWIRLRKFDGSSEQRQRIKNGSGTSK